MYLVVASSIGGNTLLVGGLFSYISVTKLGPFVRKEQLKSGSLLTGY